jgi:aryl-alcohol dehydrogenase-like predicted oxidoreductase
MTNTVVLGERRVTRIGLGTNRLRQTAQHVALIRDAVDAGVQMIDTAHLYTGGDSEQAIGAALSGSPAMSFVATKGGFGGAGHGRPEVLHREIDESLARLRTSRIELYYLHRVDPETPLEDSLRAMGERVARGQIRHIGISEVSVEEIVRARKVMPIAAVQNDYSIAERKHDDVVDYCAAEGIIFVPFFPLRGAETPAVRSMAERHGATPTQIALAWLLRRSPTMLPIPGTLSSAHVKENLAALTIELSRQEFETVSAARPSPGTSAPSA